MSVSFWLVVALFVSLAGLIAYYATVARWRDYLAGWSLMTLLVSFGVLVGFTLVARFIPNRDLMLGLYNFTLTVLVLAVWFVGAVMHIERARARRDAAAATKETLVD